jgi:hypothetical protein
MEREHLIIIALILVALYMMNTSSSKDKVTGMGPANRIRYTDPLLPSSDIDPMGGTLPADKGSHIRTRREGFASDCPPGAACSQRIRHSDKYIGGSQHIKNHIRHNNRNNMFNAMMEGCGDYNIKTKEPFRFTNPCCEKGSNCEQDCIGN